MADNRDIVTVQDCMTLYQQKGIRIVIRNGHIIGFTNNKNGLQSGNFGQAIKK